VVLKAGVIRNCSVSGMGGEGEGVHIDVGGLPRGLKRMVPRAQKAKRNPESAFTGGGWQ